MLQRRTIQVSGRADKLPRKCLRERDCARLWPTVMQILNNHHGTTHNGTYVHLRETPHGNLDLVLSERGREDFAAIESIRDRYGNRPALLTLLADHLERGWELIPPRDLGTLALGPILARAVERDASGSVVGIGPVYWYPDFPIYDEIDELLRQGFLELQGSA